LVNSQNGSRVTGADYAVQFVENQMIVMKNVYLCVSDLMMLRMKSTPTLF